MRRVWKQCMPAVCAFLLLHAPRAFAAELQKEFIFTRAPFSSSHASTIVELKNGEYEAAWFGGTAEGNPDVAIWAARRTATGWSAPVELAREPGVPTWNPVLFHAKSGRLWLYYKFGPSYTWWTAGRRHSDDEGRSWSPIEHLPAGIYGPIRVKPLVLPSGEIVSGTSVESYSSWAAWIELSHDDGVSWTRTGPITLPQLEASAQKPTDPSGALAGPEGIIQPVVVPFGGKHLRLYARSSSQIDAVRRRDSRIVLIYNDTASGRTPLNLAVSADGDHFRNFSTLSPVRVSSPIRHLSRAATAICT